MGDLTKAIFLSYASQDAEAARGLCEALRSAGVEVWFDADGGLEHGDEWDAKIRRQIKECVLFIPLISANTQAREEGYFRIEWELAAQRAMGIASGVPFILPVVIDETRESGALVPDRFRAVQWMRLPGGMVTPEVRQRFLKLWSHRTGLVRHQAEQHDLEAGRPRPAEIGSHFGETLTDTVAPVQSGVGRPLRGRLWWIIGGAVLLVAAGLIWPKLQRTESPSAGGPPRRPSTPEKATPAASPADALVTRAYALTEKMNYTRDNLAIAEDLTRRATEAAADSARAWAARAYVQACYILRGWDTGEKRRQDTQEFANRALALDPNAVDALLALGYLLNSQNASAQAEVVLRRAIAIRPDDPRPRRSLTLAVSRQGREDEALAMGQEIVRLFPRDPLAHYGLAGGYLGRADFAAALASYEAAIAAEPFAGALLAKAMLLAAWRGDLTAARATLEQLAPADRTEDRAVGVAMWLGLIERQPARVHAAAALTARTYLDDSHAIARGPKAAGAALAYQLEHKEVLARQQWQAAETVLRQRLRDRPETSADHALLATVLGWLGRADDAAREIAPFEALAREQPAVASAILLAKFYAAVGDAAKALPYLQQALNKHQAITDHLLPLDPWWDKIRGQPEFITLLAETKARSATAPGSRRDSATTRRRDLPRPGTRRKGQGAPAGTRGDARGFCPRRGVLPARAEARLDRRRRVRHLRAAQQCLRLPRLGGHPRAQGAVPRVGGAGDPPGAQIGAGPSRAGRGVEHLRHQPERNGKTPARSVGRTA